MFSKTWKSVMRVERGAGVHERRRATRSRPRARARARDARPRTRDRCRRIRTPSRRSAPKLPSRTPTSSTRARGGSCSRSQLKAAQARPLARGRRVRLVRRRRAARACARSTRRTGCVSVIVRELIQVAALAAAAGADDVAGDLRAGPDLGRETDRASPRGAIRVAPIRRCGSRSPRRRRRATPNDRRERRSAGCTTRCSTRKPYLFARNAISSSQPRSSRRDSPTTSFAAVDENAVSCTARSGRIGTSSQRSERADR